MNYQNQKGLLGHENLLKQLSEPSKKWRNASRMSIDQKLITFKEMINEGSFYTCVVCQTCLYKKSVFYYGKNVFKTKTSNFNLVRSFNSNAYICKTCLVKCQKGKFLCQAVSNNLEVFDLSVECQSIRKLEKILQQNVYYLKKSLLCQVARCQKHL